MLYRLWTRRRFLSARRVAQRWAGALRDAGALRLTLDEAGFRLTGAALSRAWPFAGGIEIEEASELVYVWPRRGEPLVWPSRADVTETQAFVAYARARCGLSAPRPLADDDD